MLTHMAEDWCDNLIFSDKHIVPHEEALIFAVFPAVKQQMSASPHFELAIREQCGLIFEFMADRYKDRSIKLDDPRLRLPLLPVFPTCKILHKDQLIPLQKAINITKSLRGRKLVLSN